MTPSSWSHVVLIHPKLLSRVYEISLEPQGGFHYPVPTNGLQYGKIESYRDRAVYPNIALLGIPSGDKLKWEEIHRTFNQFQKQRTSLDAMELIVRWLAFVWGAGRAGNPLLEGYGIPSSAMLEIIFSALGYDLTPGLESRSSCPEAIWQAVKWWHNYYDQEGRSQPRCVHTLGGYAALMLIPTYVGGALVFGAGLDRHLQLIMLGRLPIAAARSLYPGNQNEATALAGWWWWWQPAVSRWPSP